MTSTEPATKPKTKTTESPGEAVISTSQGKTTIADTVVSKIAGISTREVHGVHNLGGGAQRIVGQLRDRIPGASVNHSQGVSVEVGEKQAAIDIEIVIEYGVAISDLAGGIRRNVIGAVEKMTGLEVTEVNIVVNDIFIPGESNDEDDTPPPPPAPARVQ